VTSASRRRFLVISAGLAGKVAATGAISLPVLATMSKRAQAVGPSRGGSHCFLRGTYISTPDGEISVEDLRIGALVETLRGPMPVKWIGRQSFRKNSRSWHWSMAPIRVARLTLSDQYPHRDLYLSPSHSLLVDGVLIPVEMLVNGSSIAPAMMDDRDVIDYFHIELETHEVIYAEGAPAETLLVTGDREAFSNFVEYERLYGTDLQAPMKPFAPILKYTGARGELERLLQLAVSPVVDIRDPILRARNRIAARAELIDV
jgi:hypothetical protein